MKYSLFDFQKIAVNSLLKKMEQMQKSYVQDHVLSAVSLTAPTGSGKTVISAAVAEALFYGNDVYPGDDRACILWLSDSPSLNAQTMKRFEDATDLLVGATTMEAIGPEFAKSYSKFQPGHIYFLNRQLLSAKGKLSNQAEGGRSFYDVLANTIEDDGIHLYLFIDEAHRGLGTGDNKATSDATNKTIYAKLIDGQKGINPPMPVVIGISATPERFDAAMGGRKERDIKAAVVVPVSEVKKSGLIKDVIELRTPKKSADTKHQDLTQACAKLAESTKLWKKYCLDEKIAPIVQPLMVLQVEDRVSNETLGELCKQIHTVLPWTDPLTCFANVFGEHNDITTPYGKIPYVKPEDVQEKTEVKVLFAKDAVSTGWDCPRAEVIYSRRRRTDPTYIAQLIGRMIRTPLARRINSQEELNGVSCYLPEFDEKTVETVVDRLKEDNIAPVTTIIKNPVDVSWYGNTKKKLETRLQNINQKQNDSSSTSLTANSLENVTKNDDTNDMSSASKKNPDDEFIALVDEDLDANEIQDVLGRIPKADSDAVKACFESIVTRTVRHDKPNHFLDLWNCIDIICSDLSPDSNLDSRISGEFYNNIEAGISKFPAEFKRAFNDINNTQMIIKRIDPLTGEEFEDLTEGYEVKNDSQRLTAFYKNVVSSFSGSSDYVKAYINKRQNEAGDDQEKAIKRICAVGQSFEIMQFMEEWAENKTKQLLDEWGPYRESVSDANRETWNNIEGNVKPWIEMNLNVNSAITRQNKDYEAFPKHIISDENGWSYHNLNPLEKAVLNTELSHPLNVAWYRNQPRNLNASLSIPYELNGQLQNNYPDFIFFQNVNGKIVPAIVDPHGDWLGDSVAKLKGYVEYLKDHPKMFARVLALTDEKDGEVRYLDLMNPAVQTAVENYKGSTAKELFTGPLSKVYNLVKE